MRVACLLVPELPLVAELRAEPELAGRPLAIAAGPGPRAEVLAASPEALACGVRPGASVVHARAASSALEVRIASPALDRAARDALLDVALSASPRALPAPRDGDAWRSEAAIFLDATGTSTLFGSEGGLAAALGKRAERVGLPAAVAVAASRGVSHLAARTLAPGEVRVVPAGHEAAFLAPLPLDLLAPGDRFAEACTRFGLRRMGDLARLPRRALATRLGPEALRLAALARGEEPTRPLPLQTGTRCEEATDLEYPVDRLEPLGFVLRGLLSRLVARLAVRGLACGDLELGLGLEGGGRDARRIGVAAATDDVRTLLRLVSLALEARPPTAAVLALSLASEGRPLRGDQLDLFRPPGPAPAVLDRTLSELEAVCGEGRVGAPVVADTHHPDALELGPFAPGAMEDARLPAPAPSGRGALGLRALRPPVPARVRCQGGKPRWVASPVANGDVLETAGPWRTTGGWWSADGRFAMDHFDLQTSDGTVARFRYDALQRAWFVDGVYD